MITILLFARIREAIGQESIRLDWEEEGGTAKRLLEVLAERYPEVGFQHVMVAVNERYVRPEDTVPPGSTVALIPPVSGG